MIPVKRVVIGIDLALGAVMLIVGLLPVFS